MKRKYFIYCICFLISIVLFVNSYLRADATNIIEETKDVIVVYKNTQGKNAVYSLATTIRQDLDKLHIVSATLKTEDIAELQSNPNIKLIEENKQVKLASNNSKQLQQISSISYESDLWNIKAVGADIAWEQGYTGKGVKVAVIDSGITPHPDLKIAGGVSFVQYTKSYYDDNGHGTNVAGVIAAKKNDYGVVGVAPDVELYAVKSVRQNGLGYIDEVYAGIEWAMEHNIDIVNLSVGDLANEDSYYYVIQQAYQSGLLIVAASGNDDALASDDENTVAYPAKYPEVIAVGATEGYS